MAEKRHITAVDMLQFENRLRDTVFRIVKPIEERMIA